MKYKRDKVDFINDIFSGISEDISKKLFKVINDKYNTDLDDLNIKLDCIDCIGYPILLHFTLFIKKKDESMELYIYVIVYKDNKVEVKWSNLFQPVYKNLNEFIGIDITDILIEMKYLFKDFELKGDDIEKEIEYSTKLKFSIDDYSGSGDEYGFDGSDIDVYIDSVDEKSLVKSKTYILNIRGIKIKWVVNDYEEKSKLIEGLVEYLKYTKEDIKEEYVYVLLDNVKPYLENTYYLIGRILNNIK